jgi:hypothetical protein
MAYNTNLAARMQAVIAEIANVSEKKMFGGVAFLVNGNMACGVHGDGMIVRVGEAGHAAAMSQPHVRVFDMPGRPMKGWVVVDPPGIEADADLKAWVAKGIDFAAGLPPKAA